MGTSQPVSEVPLPGDVRQALRLKSGANYGDAIALAMARLAIKGTVEAPREMREGIEGKATQRVELGDEPEGIRIEVVNIGRMYERDDAETTPPHPYPELTSGR